jgi:hypothetical protein
MINTKHIRHFMPKKSPNKKRYPRAHKPPKNRCGICRAPLSEHAEVCPNCGCGICKEMSI